MDKKTSEKFEFEQLVVDVITACALDKKQSA